MKRVVFVERPQGAPSESNFKIETVDSPKLEGNGILVKTIYLSVDPYMRGRMSEGKSYAPGWDLNAVPLGGGVGQITEASNAGEFKVGDLVFTFSYPWAEFVFFSEEKLKDLTKLDSKTSKPSYALSLLGMPGMTAYFGAVDILQPKEGETLLVTGAAGAVGSMVGQIGKILGLRVVGIAGSDEKIKLLKEEYGFDEAINYKTVGADLSNEIKKAAPKGVDCFFDNVGGPTMDAVFENLNVHSRVSLCGAISQYNGANSTGPRLNTTIFSQGILVKGFIIFRDYGNRIPEGMKQMKEWLDAGKIKIEETNVDGIENLPKALVHLFTGTNVGKQIVTVSQLQ